jgi:hypothetical protein
MKTRQGTEVCYNVQVAVDHQHPLIVAHEVTNAVTDQAQLATIAKRAKAALDADQLKVLADMGYDDGDEVKTCVAAGLIPYIPTPNTSANTHLGLFGKDAFVYEAQHDCSRCPTGQPLTFRFETVEQIRHIRSYSTSACQACRFKPPCTRNQEHRRITRWVHAYLLEEMQPRVTDHPEKVTSRKSLVEHPFGTMKRWMDQGYFLTRGLTRVRGEMRLTILVYNVKRVGSSSFLVTGRWALCLPPFGTGGG